MINTSIFGELSYWLSQHQALWRYSPFLDSYHLQPRWMNDYPCLWEEIASLSDENVVQFKGDSLTLVKQLQPRCHFLSYYDYFLSPIKSSLDNTVKTSLDPLLTVGMPGKKRQQIEQFISQLHSLPKQQWLEWCAGKGYLGRGLVTQTKAPVVSLEWQSDLVQAGQNFAEQYQLDMVLHQQDVFEDSCEQHLSPLSTAVALHACGDLHTHLIKLGAKKKLPALAIAPCCFHLIRSHGYQPLSKLGKHFDLQLSKLDLRVPLQQTVTGGKRVVGHRQVEMTFRLGLDSLLRESGITTHYISIPSIKKSQLKEGFKAFCLWACEQKHLQLPADTDFDSYLTIGQKRFGRMERFSLAQQLFQRPLELWLLMDKALYLQQQGYKVHIHPFCSESLTPRNLLLKAVRVG